MSARYLAAIVAVLALAGCGGGGNSGSEMVWCVGPGEKVTPELKRDYPELHISKAACDAIK